jgi:branched-chain amino acid transport system permease protein
LVLIAILATVPAFLSTSNQSLCMAAALACVAILGVNLIVGSAGQISIAGAALMAVGAFVSNIYVNDLSLPFPLPIICSGITTAAVGILLTFPALRLRGIYLVLATIAFHFIVLDMAYVYQNDTVGELGFVFNSQRFLGLKLDTGIDWYYVDAIAVLILGVLIWNLMRSKYGRAWLAIRAAESAGEAAGVNVVAYKAIAFGVSSFCLGVAGALYAYNYHQVTTDSFPFTLAATQLAMVLVGGLGSMGGALTGAVALTLLPTGVQQIINALPADLPLRADLGSKIYLLTGALQGVIIIIFVLRVPGGLAELGRAATRLTKRLLRRVDGEGLRA